MCDACISDHLYFQFMTDLVKELNEEFLAEQGYYMRNLNILLIILG